MSDVGGVIKNRHTWIGVNSISGDSEISPLQLLFAILPFTAAISALIDRLVGV